MPQISLRDQALQKIANKTKPPFSLGLLETVAVDMATIQGSLQPSAEPAAVLIFAADHGVYAERVSPYPQAVTAQMVTNIVSGGAASSVLARTHGVDLKVIDVGVLTESAAHPSLHSARVRAGSRNMKLEAAMSEDELAAALAAGRAAVLRQHGRVLIIGEMGLANTTAATALCCAMLNLPASTLTGPGTGLDAAGVSHKAQVIQQILERHTPNQTGERIDAREILRCMGGLEIAAMVGAYLAVAHTQTVLLIDGFIASAALLIAVALEPAVRANCIFAHTSGEPGHHPVLAALHATPLLNLGMRLGEATGALTAYPLLRSACALFDEMASFESAGVSDR